MKPKLNDSEMSFEQIVDAEIERERCEPIKQIKQIVPAPGWRVVAGYCDVDDRPCHEDLAVIGWAVVANSVELIVWEPGYESARLLRDLQAAHVVVPPGGDLDWEELTKRIVALAERRMATNA